VKQERIQFLKFVFVSGCSAVFTVFVRFLFSFVAPFEIAVVLAHVVGMTTAFTLNRLFVFASGRGILAQYARFVTVNMMSLVITTVVSTTCYRVVFPALHFDHYTALLSHFIGLSATALPSYLGHRFFSFRSRAPENSAEQL
jgi:putative flippase GtrA